MREKIKKFAATNLYLKIISLVIAIITWLAIVTEQIEEATFQGELYLKKPQNFLISSEIPREIAVTVKGSRSDIKALKSRKITATIDLKNAKPGNSVYRILPEKINIPNSFTIVSINPASIFINIVEEITKEVKIKPVFIGTLERGYSILDFNVTPNTTILKGIRKELANLNEVYLEPINLNRRTESFKVKLPLNLTYKNIWLKNNVDFWLEVNIWKNK